MNTMQNHFFTAVPTLSEFFTEAVNFEPAKFLRYFDLFKTYVTDEYPIIPPVPKS